VSRSSLHRRNRLVPAITECKNERLRFCVVGHGDSQIDVASEANLGANRDASPPTAVKAFRRKTDRAPQRSERASGSDLRHQAISQLELGVDLYRRTRLLFKRCALEANSGSHHLERLSQLVGRLGLLAQLEVVAQKPIHIRILMLFDGIGQFRTFLRKCPASAHLGVSLRPGNGERILRFRFDGGRWVEA
jgi:hypothetical protein